MSDRAQCARIYAIHLSQMDAKKHNKSMNRRNSYAIHQFKSIRSGIP